MAYDMFVKLEGIDGESSDDQHQNWIEILSFSHGMSQPVGSSPSRTGGRTGARVDMGEFSFTKVFDKATPNLAIHCCDGTHIPTVTVECCEATGEKHCFMKYTMSDCIVSSVQPSGSSNEEGARPIEEIGVQFGQIEWEYTPTDHMGKKGAAITKGWDLETNKAL